MVIRYGLMIIVLIISIANGDQNFEQLDYIDSVQVFDEFFPNESSTETTDIGLFDSTTTTATVSVKPTYRTNRWTRTTPSYISSITTIKATKTTRATTVGTTRKPKLKCNTDGSYNGEYGIEYWPAVEVGNRSIVMCPHANGFASWLCMKNGRFEHKGPIFNHCTACGNVTNCTNCSKPDHNYEMSKCSDWLQTLDDSNITNIEDAINTIETICNKTESNHTINNSGNLFQVISIIDKVQHFIDNSSEVDLDNVKTYASNVVETFSHLIDKKNAWNNSTAEEKTNLSSKILQSIQFSSFTLVCHLNESNKSEQINNMNIRINTFIANTGQRIVFSMQSPANSGENSSIIIPEGVQFDTRQAKCNNNNNTAVGALIDNIQDYLLGGINETLQINSDVLSFSLVNRTQSLKLTGDVIIKLKHKNGLKFGDKIDCVFWDFEALKWRNEGCRKVDEESHRFETTCKCDHLTNFAALMDISGRESNDQLKSILTYCCGVLSIIGLILTINLIMKAKHVSERNPMKENLNEMRSIITCNLCICLLITNMLVLFGMDRTNITWLCQLSSGLLVYSLLSSFFWMLMEGNFLYRSLVSCFNTEFNGRLLYCCGYGSPLLIMIIGLVIVQIKEQIFFEALFDRRYNYFCWISSMHYPNHIWIVVGPAIFVILLNILIMFISIKTALNVIKNYKPFAMNDYKSKAKIKQIISFIFISFLLGITWISFLLYIHQTFDFYFSYVFIVLNGSQGFFIFLYHLSLNDCNSRKTSNVSKF